MAAARLARRRSQAREIATLEAGNAALKAEVERLRGELARNLQAGSTPKP